MEKNVVEPLLWQKWTLLTGKLVLTVLLSWQSAQLAWMVIAPTPLVLKAPAQASTDSDDGQVRGTAAYHLFGEATAVAPRVVQKAVEAPDTRLKLTLMGINQSSREELSSAIISAAGRSGEFYRMGDTVQGRTRLAGVYPDKVILDTAGKLETLKFEEHTSRGSDVRAVPEAKSRSGASSLKERFSKVRNATELVDLATSELEDDPLEALGRMGLAAQGSGQGYRVQPGSPLMQFKLRPGDLLLSINGQSLGDPASDQSLLADLQNTESVRIEVQRGNDRFTVNHRLN
ncbi:MULTISPECIES: type II secretion system protein N [unclassified Oceanobacter]|uniref:type II secretion system protein N n=1 Tax=unclassified Oceanobacter TaxID=2620260 RepID=UPI0026E2ADD2|nr:MULTISPECIES: type II secretion system protein N [unclassified Oceanobacter]MDO6681657.1 type II secretion system protein N [Oceanobacter sp. 5_MG-2023]MDP2505715.1 type II secretion system protein N [Oceanobacter sp. 3_MG-2023]MDP2547458.1 type II secretion system protein N [Oceanobacter sp. 4_MG-2023]MDP2608246.1 type II secretion system protein N [Oceanobacter sp. 1_MG-2023]MDP2612131.1 type II secretion system protein N [Oceanobacter sp. 2_MG-2023]